MLLHHHNRTTTRTRHCLHGFGCPGANSEGAPCEGDGGCPVDGQWGHWGDYSACSAMCGLGTKGREMSKRFRPEMYLIFALESRKSATFPETIQTDSRFGQGSATALLRHWAESNARGPRLSGGPARATSARSTAAGPSGASTASAPKTVSRASKLGVLT